MKFKTLERAGNFEISEPWKFSESHIVAFPNFDDISVRLEIPRNVMFPEIFWSFLVFPIYWKFSFSPSGQQAV